MTPLIGIGACVSIQFGVLESVKRGMKAANAKNGIKDLTLGQLFVGTFFGRFLGLLAFLYQGA